jgi:hypothetical protein
VLSRLFLLFIAALLWSNPTTSQGIEPKTFDNCFKLLPKPQKTELLAGKSFPVRNLRFLHLKGNIERPVLEPPLGALPLADNPGKGVLTLAIAQGGDVPASPEGYIMEIKDGQITITSRGKAGLFYGCQTLLQLLEDAADQQIDIPSCRFNDYPDLPYRAIHLDIKYHLDAGHYYYQMIDRLARIKINAVIVEFEDKIRYRKAAKVGAGNAMTVEEFAALSRYAMERNIEISPLVQGLGHVPFILKHEEYRHLRDNPASDWVFDPANPETYKLQFSLYDDAIAATPYGKYLHVGGDEVWDEGHPLGAKSGKSPFEMQMYWLNKVCDYARAHNRIPIFWDDMLLKCSGLIGTTENTSLSNEQIEKTWKDNQHRLDESIGLFPKNCVYMRWAYSHPQVLGNVKAMEWYKSHGLQVMGAPAAQNMSAMLPRDNSLFQPIKDFCKVASDIKLNGLLCTLWDDSSPHFETYWRGLHYYSALSWHYEDIQPADAKMVFRHRFYAPELSDPSCEFQDLLEQALNFWDGALLSKGGRTHYLSFIEFISLPEKAKPGEWSQKYKAKLERAKIEIARHDVIAEKIKKAKQLSRRNFYSLALMNRMNDLQVYSSHLLLLLEKYDQARSRGETAVASRQLLDYINTFPQVRKAYEDVFSETRFLSNPEGHILDQNIYTLLANGTNNSDWMYVHELKVNGMIRELLNPT